MLLPRNVDDAQVQQNCGPEPLGSATCDVGSQSVLSLTDVWEFLYSELKGTAASRLSRERVDHTLQATALVHEVYLKLTQGCSANRWQDQNHLLAAANEAMRRILVDHARSKLARKRGGAQIREPLVDIPVDLPLPPDELLAIHEALEQFAAEDPVKAELVKLRVFAGMDHRDAACHLGISRATADRYWNYAKARLYLLIQGGEVES